MARVDRDSDGGGVMVVFKLSLNKVLVVTAEHKIHDAEMLWQRLDNGRIKM